MNAVDPYPGVPTGSVPRAVNGTYLKSEGMADLSGVCKEPIPIGPWPAHLERAYQESRAGKTQVGGTHYSKHKIQPWDYVAANDLGYFEGSIVKYITRWRDKGGVEDLKKARHFLDKLIEVSSA
jgi:hypothetical protein